jgi:uncharacterized membrane protein YeaQ/YmgE (transglycosylase-associated protein family)
MEIVTLVLIVLVVLVALSVLGTLLALAKVLVVGLIIGGLARWLLPGRHSMGWLMTALYGMCGAVLGRFAAHQLHLYSSLVELALEVGASAALIAVMANRRRLTR